MGSSCKCSPTVIYDKMSKRCTRAVADKRRPVTNVCSQVCGVSWRRCAPNTRANAANCVCVPPLPICLLALALALTHSLFLSLAVDSPLVSSASACTVYSIGGSIADCGRVHFCGHVALESLFSNSTRLISATIAGRRASGPCLHLAIQSILRFSFYKM